MSDTSRAEATGAETVLDGVPISAEELATFIRDTSMLPKQVRLEVFGVYLKRKKQIRNLNVIDESTPDVRALEPLSVAELVAYAKESLGVKSFDEATLRAAVQEAIVANPRAVADFKGGKDAAKMSIVGAVMKAKKGASNDMVRRLVDEELAKA